MNYTGMEIDTIGHHGTIGTAATEIFDENTGAIKPNARIGKKQTLVFENGITYVIEVKVLGYGIINFEYTANETNKILEGDANVDQGNYPLVDPEAVECVVQAGQCSVSMLQRRFRIGYNRAARIVDEMEARGIVGPQDGYYEIGRASCRERV